MSIHTEVQYAEGVSPLPDKQSFSHWLSVIETPEDQTYEVSIRVVDEEESRDLNNTYRSKNKPTNVLSFPMDVPIDAGIHLLGDIILCAPVVREEAQAAGTSEESHWAHLAIHGVLHLQGYDHETEEQAQIMETLEIELLSRLGFANPYET